MYFCHGYLLRLETCVVQLEYRLHLKMQLCIFLGISFAVITCVTFLSIAYIAIAPLPFEFGQLRLSV